MTLEFDPEAYDEIAQLAFERRDTGARALRSIIEKYLRDPKFEIPGTDAEKVIITKDYLTNKGKYITIEKEKKRRTASA